MYAVTTVSSNKKTGPIALVTSGRSTCNPRCAFKGICYPEGGGLRLHWDKVSTGLRGVDFDGVLSALKGLRKDAIWRWGDAGDLPGAGARLDVKCVEALSAVATKGRHIAFAYTHKAHTARNLAAIALTNMRCVSAGFGFCINLSTEGLKKAASLYKKVGDTTGVVTVVPSTMGPVWKSVVHDGVKVVQCPAEIVKAKGVAGTFNCAGCGGGKPLCARADRDYVIGFTAHGSMTKKVNTVLEGVI